MTRKIVFVVNSMHTGGAERIAATLVNAWARRGHDVTLVLTYSGRGECHFEMNPNVRMTYLADHVPTGAGRLGSYVRRFRALRKLLVDSKPDVVYSFLTDVNVAVLLASRRMTMPVVVSERTFPPAHRIGDIWKLLRRWTYPSAACVVMQTADGLDWLKREIPRAKGFVVPNPVALPLPVREPVVPVGGFRREGQKLIVAVGRVDAGKQFDVLIRAFSIAAAVCPEWDLAILGNGPEREALLRQVSADASIAARVHLPGRVGNVGDWYRQADLFAMTSRYEGFPNVLLEAMGHGCAAVSFDCDTGPRDVIRHGVNGRLVPPSDGAEGFAQALLRYMQDDDERRRAATQAADVLNRFSLERVLALWDTVADSPLISLSKF
jgi:GalNAc-alpha-(1->4)-GalNAc-alpha-(1->3)-diNAcBac-PP-undecaprenol alpha-1,4-N-acetyl-D-galactosaminyltransferase